MRAADRKTCRRGRRRALTLVELLLTAAISAMTATAGASLLYAVVQASTQCRDARELKNAGRFVMSRISKAIRCARGIGDVSSNAIVLWEEDTDGDDAVSVFEAAVIMYDPRTRSILYAKAAQGASQANMPLPMNVFTNAAQAKTYVAQGANTDSVVWAEGVDAFTFTGFPAQTETRIVNVAFEMTLGDDAMAFSQAVSPRLSADYVFDADAQVVRDDLDGRLGRKYYSRWTGFGDIKRQ